MIRDDRIVRMAGSLCDRCKDKIVRHYSSHPNETPAGMAVFVLRVCCRRCQKNVLQGAASMRGGV